VFAPVETHRKDLDTIHAPRCHAIPAVPENTNAVTTFIADKSGIYFPPEKNQTSAKPTAKAMTLRIIQVARGLFGFEP
jgi:hypothetical protein